MAMLPSIDRCKIVIVGLGYVGLPLAVEFAKNLNCRRTGKHTNRSVIGFDIDAIRISELISGYDRTNEISSLHSISVFDVIKKSCKLIFFPNTS